MAAVPGRVILIRHAVQEATAPDRIDRNQGSTGSYQLSGCRRY